MLLRACMLRFTPSVHRVWQQGELKIKINKIQLDQEEGKEKVVSERAVSQPTWTEREFTIYEPHRRRERGQPSISGDL